MTMISQDLSSDAWAPDGWRRALWLGLLVAATAVFSFGLSCACPFAGLGAAAAMTLRGRDAVLLTVAAWLVNQAIGFGLLDYPWDAGTLTWGVVLGAVAVLSTLAALGTIRQFGGRQNALIAGVVFAAAFIVYEGALFMVSAGALGGVEDFAAGIVVRILGVNAAAFAALLILSGVGSAFGLVAKPRLELPLAGRA
jgi:hypothetical protein